MNLSKRYVWSGAVAAVIATGLIAGAIRPRKSAQAAPGIVPDVQVASVEQQDVPITGEWISTLDGLVNADVRAQVTGYLVKQGYQEGAFVKEGQLLFQMDPRPFQAALDQSEGQLAQAKATLANAQAVQRRTELDVERYTPLAEQQAASALACLRRLPVCQCGRTDGRWRRHHSSRISAISEAQCSNTSSLFLLYGDVHRCRWNTVCNDLQAACTGLLGNKKVPS